MNTSDFRKTRGMDYHPTPPYGVHTTQKQDKQNRETFTSKGKQFPDSQDLMGGPQYKSLEGLTKENKAAYSRSMDTLIKEGTLWSEGRFHQ